MDQLMNSSHSYVPDALIPYKEKLSPRFYTVRRDVIDFIREVVRPAGKVYEKQRQEMWESGRFESRLHMPQPPVL